MKIKDIAERIEKIVPLELAQDWDNVGLLIGDPQRNVKNILLTIDVTGEVAAEAKRLKTDLIISYHPIIWDGLKKIVAEPPVKLGAKKTRNNRSLTVAAVFSVLRYPTLAHLYPSTALRTSLKSGFLLGAGMTK